VASPANSNLPSATPVSQTAGNLMQSMSRTLSQKTHGGKDLLWTPNQSNPILKNSSMKRTLESRESPDKIDDKIPIG
jgi:hypothetical protein